MAIAQRDKLAKWGSRRARGPVISAGLAVWALTGGVSTDSAGDSHRNAWFYVGLTLAGFVALLSVMNFLAYQSEKRSSIDVDVVSKWLPRIGPDVDVMVFHGGPKLSASGRVNTVGAHHAAAGAGLPHVAIAITVAGLISNAVSAGGDALSPERRRKQATLLEEVRGRATARLNELLDEYKHSLTDSRHRRHTRTAPANHTTQSELISLTHYALNTVERVGR